MYSCKTLMCVCVCVLIARQESVVVCRMCLQFVDTPTVVIVVVDLPAFYSIFYIVFSLVF